MQRSATEKRRSFLLIFIAFLAFVSLGLPDVILGVAWPSIRREFGVPLSQLGSLLMAGTCGYLVSSFFAGTVRRSLGIGGVLVISNLLVLASLIGNATTPAFNWMIGFALVGGLGAGAIDAAINAFAAGAFAPRVVTWLHACWGIGATIGPATMTAIIARGHSWRIGYASVAVVIGAMCVLFFVTMRLWRQAATTPEAPREIEAPAGLLETLRLPIVWLHIALFFVYTGIEVTAGQWFFSLFTESRRMSPATAGAIVSGYWLSLTIGRIAFGFAADHVNPLTLLRLAMSCAPLAVILIWANVSTTATLVGAIVLGVALAPIYPLLISLTPARVGGRFAAHAIGFQVSAATVGVGLIPSFAGVLARRTGLEIICPYLLSATVALLFLHEMTILATRLRVSK